MPDLRLLGCRPQPLLDYLKALGVLRVVAEQADPGARGRWHDDAFELRSRFDEDALVAFLVDEYVPSPIITPWNGGSGFYPKDKQGQKAFELLEASGDPRLEPLTAAIRSARAVLERMGLETRPSGDDKAELLRSLRAELPDRAVTWMDAALALTGSDVGYPPLLGSGGNDGRFDYGANFAIAVGRIFELAPRRGAPPSRDLLREALWAEPSALDPLSLGHLERDASPVMAPVGEVDSLGNPWELVLALEGSLMLGAGAARRHGGASAHAVAPFTVRVTAAGFGSAAFGEEGRDELWLPLWAGWAGVEEIEAVAREGRAQIGRRQAVDGLDFARAAAELGVARGITAFARFALLNRAGQSRLAVPAGRVEVRERPAVRALLLIDTWLRRAMRHAAGECPSSHRAMIRRLERGAFAFAADGSPERAQSVLELLGETEIVLGRGGDPGRIPPPLTGAAAEPWLAAADDESPEFAMAVAIASLRDPRSRNLPAVRDYLTGSRLDERGRRVRDVTGPVVPRRLEAAPRLAALHVRRFQDAQRHAQADPRFPQGMPAPLGALRLAATGQLDLARVIRLATGLSLLDFHGVAWRPRQPTGPPAPALDVLALAWHGTPRVPLVPRPDWPRRLMQGAVSPVLDDALRRLRMAELAPLVDTSDLQAAPDGVVLAATLLPRLAPSTLEHIATRLCGARGETAPPTTEGAAS